MSRRGVSTDPLTLGPNAAALKSKLSRKRWKKFVRTAHKRGFSVEGLASGVPTALKERSRAGVLKEAKRSINTAYAPAEKELSLQESRNKALSDKRAADNKVFLDWQTAQAAKLQAGAEQADAAVAARQQQIQSDLATQAAAAQQNVLAQAAARIGNVSNPAQSTALDLSNERLRGLDLLAAERTRTSQQIGTNAERNAKAQSNNFAIAAAAEARRVAETWAEASKLGDERQKLVLQKAADANKEAARLFDNEISKADKNRQYAAAATELGIKSDIDAQKLAADAADKAASRALERRKLRTSTKLANKKLSSDLRIHKDNLAAKQRATLLKFITDSKKGKEDSKLTANQKVALIREDRRSRTSIDTAVSKIRTELSKNPPTPTGKIRKKFARLGDKGPAPWEINVAFDLVDPFNTTGGKLSKKNRAVAKRNFWRVPKEWL